MATMSGNSGHRVPCDCCRVPVRRWALCGCGGGDSLTCDRCRLGVVDQWRDTCRRRAHLSRHLRRGRGRPRQNGGRHCSLTDRASPADLQDDCYIKCSFCGQGLSSFQALKEHVDASHPGGAFPCVHCAATFPSRDQLEKHEQLHPNTQQVVRLVGHYSSAFKLPPHTYSYEELKMKVGGSPELL
ncbi:hypothetical protein J6590_002186 [Homalodisca vitripennis]|nr:hypothetical protein J6590_002186 [Homalodisca vitripennis]